MRGREVNRGAQSVLNPVSDTETELLQREVNDYLARGDFKGATELIDRHHGEEPQSKEEGRQKVKRGHEVSTGMHDTVVIVLSMVQNTAGPSQPEISSSSRGSTGNGFKREFTPNIDPPRFTIPAESGFTGAGTSIRRRKASEDASTSDTENARKKPRIRDNGKGRRAYGDSDSDDENDDDWHP